MFISIVAGCKSHPPPAVEIVATASPSASPSLPADFPSAVASKIAGTLSGKRFEVAKAVLRIDPAGAKLDLYSWSEGVACEPQFAPKPDQLYVSIALPAASAKAGGAIRSGDTGVFVTYKRPTLDHVEGVVAAVVLDAIGDRASGRLKLTAPDGTNVAGAFDAAVCTGAQRESAAGSLLDLAWGTADVDPAKLPTAAVTTISLGKTASPVAVEAIDWQDATLGQHELHFFLTKPAKPCGFDQMTPGFKIGFPDAFKAGATVRAKVTTTTRTGDPFAVVLWSEPGNVVGMEGGGRVSAIIDSATPDELRGRVFAWFDDASKSMIAGAFTAKRCHVKP